MIKTITVRDCANFHAVLANMPTIPVRASFKVGVIAHAISGLVHAYNKTRADKLREAGVREGEPAPDLLASELDDLLGAKNEVEFQPLYPNDFIDPHSGFRDMSPSLMVGLGPFLDFEPAPVVPQAAPAPVVPAVPAQPATP